jgi:hypothetical protein
MAKTYRKRRRNKSNNKTNKYKIKKYKIKKYKIKKGGRLSFDASKVHPASIQL